MKLTFLFIYYNLINYSTYLCYHIYGDMMIVYVDLLIIATIIVNFAFIKTISFFAKEKLNPFRVILGLIISVFSLLLYFLPYKAYFIIRYFIGVFIGMIVFKTKDVKIKIIEIVVFYMLTMTFIGTLFVFQVKNVIIMFVTMVYVIILYIIQNYQNIFNKDIYIIKIGKTKLKALFDSGNLSTYKNLPVIYLDSKYLNDKFIKNGQMVVQTIKDISLVDIYRGPKLFFNNKEYDVVYSFIDNLFSISNNKYNVILNSNLN